MYKSNYNCDEFNKRQIRFIWAISNNAQLSWQLWKNIILGCSSSVTSRRYKRSQHFCFFYVGCKTWKSGALSFVDLIHSREKMISKAIGNNSSLSVLIQHLKKLFCFIVGNRMRDVERVNLLKLEITGCQSSVHAVNLNRPEQKWWTSSDECLRWQRRQHWNKCIIQCINGI